MKPDLELMTVVDDILWALGGVHSRLGLYLWGGNNYLDQILQFGDIYKQTWRYKRDIRLLKKYSYTMKRDVNKFYKKYKRSK